MCLCVCTVCVWGLWAHKWVHTSVHTQAHVNTHTRIYYLVSFITMIPNCSQCILLPWKQLNLDIGFFNVTGWQLLLGKPLQWHCTVITHVCMYACVHARVCVCVSLCICRCEQNQIVLVLFSIMYVSYINMLYWWGFQYWWYVKFKLIIIMATFSIDNRVIKILLTAIPLILKI